MDARTALLARLIRRGIDPSFAQAEELAKPGPFLSPEEVPDMNCVDCLGGIAPEDAWAWNYFHGKCGHCAVHPVQSRS
jgi:hypothetical protein